MLRTELDSVNEMLSCIGEAPVNSLKSGLTEADTALRILRATDVDVQGTGWTFNYSEGMKLLPDTTGVYQIPDDTLRVSPAQRESARFVQRGGKLYNLENHSFSFPNTSSLSVDIVNKLDFESLPHPARYYITVRASRILQDRMIGAQTMHSYQAVDEQSALVSLRHYEADSGDWSYRDSRHHRNFSYSIDHGGYVSH